MAESDRIEARTDEFASAAEKGVQAEAGPDPLVALLKSGSPEALAQLYRRYYREMTTFARSYAQDLALAEDLVQDTWTAIIQEIAMFRGKCSFKTWAFKILYNKARTIRRRESRFSAIKVLLGLEWQKAKTLEYQTSASCPYRTERWPATPEQLLLSEELRRETYKFIASLPRRQRDVYVLRDVEGWRPQTVCEFLRISPANQRVLLHRARAAIYEWFCARSQRHA
jgi:RNA polymerase sigma-70 factor, ECF subfamily